MLPIDRQPTPDVGLRWHPIAPRFGAQLEEAQLHQLDTACIETLIDLVSERGVVVAHAQDMSLDDQVHLGHQLGALCMHPAYGDRDRPEVMPVHVDATSTRAPGECWHSDLSCEPIPPAISMLRMEEVPASGGDTVFADMQHVYESLSPPIQQLLLGLTATHESPATFLDGPLVRDLPRAVHPVVRSHPVTGRRALYVNQLLTTSIVELSRRESDALLRLLFDSVAYSVTGQIRVQWANGTTVLWDNRWVQHHAVYDYHPATRHGYRVSTIGEVPFVDRSDEP